LEDNAILEKGLPVSVTTMNGSVNVVNNPELTFFPVHVVHLDGDLIIRANPKMRKLNSSYPIENISGNMEFSDLELWKSFWGFGNMKKINGDLSIKNTGISGFYGFHGIDSIHGSLSLVDNYNLEKLNFLYGLTSIQGQLNIVNNDRLKDISDLDNLQYEDIGLSNLETYDIILQDNDSLQLCNTVLFCKVVMENDKLFLIENNGQGCSSAEEIHESCTVAYSSLIETEHNIFPNPFNDFLSISLENRERIRIVGSDGNTLYDNELEAGIHKIDMTSAAPGLFVLRIGSQTVQKAIKL